MKSLRLGKGKAIAAKIKVSGRVRNYARVSIHFVSQDGQNRPLLATESRLHCLIIIIRRYKDASNQSSAYVAASPDINTSRSNMSRRPLSLYILDSSGL